MWGEERGCVRGAGGLGRRFSGVGKGLFEKLAAYVRRARWEGWLSLGEHEREDLGDRVLREGFLLLYNKHMRTTKEDISRSSDYKKGVCSQPLLLNPLL